MTTDRRKGEHVKVAVSASGKDLQAQVDPRFGRAAGFIIADPETLDFELVENTQNIRAAQGAGIQAATLVARHKAEVVLTGHCGPKAFQTLRAAGIQVVTGVSGTVKEVLARFQEGEYTFAAAPNAEGHW